MRVIIIDDEKHCREGLSILLGKHCPDLEIAGTAADAEAGLRAIESLRPDLVFLDIEMPGMNGFEMLEKCAGRNFEIVFTTAYNEYAIQAIRHSALDYLLKPVDKSELVKAVERAKQSKTAHAAGRIDQLLKLLSAQKGPARIALPTLEGLVMVDINDVIYCESESAYTKFFLADKSCIMISRVLKDAEGILEEKGFFRVHHSYLVNLQYVQRYIRGNGGEVIMSNGKNIPVSRTRRQDFLKKLEKL